MKKRLANGLLVFLVLLITIVPLSGCKKAEDKINEELTEGITEKYLEGITGGNADLDIEEGKWPSDMPAKVPKFKAGKIDGSSSITVSGTTQISVVIKDVKQKDFENYAKDLINAGFIEVMMSNAEGYMSGSYQAGEQYMSLSLDTSTGDLMIGYSGNQ